MKIHNKRLVLKQLVSMYLPLKGGEDLKRIFLLPAIED